MTNLIQQIQDDSIDPNTNLGTLLRRAKVLASTLKNEDFKKWVDNELDGYASEDDVPDYRRSGAEHRGNFVGPFGASGKNMLVSIACIPESFRDSYRTTVIRQGVGALETLMGSDPSEGIFRVPWPAELVAQVAGNIYEGYNCISAWRVVSRPQVAQVLETIRNRMLNFILELREMNPEIADSEEAIAQIPVEKSSAVFHTYIYGDQNVVAAGTDVVQNVHQKISTNDIEALLQYMREEIGVSSQDEEQLLRAIDEDVAEPEPNNYGPKVKAWILNMTTKALEGTLKVATGVATPMITKGLSRFYGWE